MFFAAPLLAFAPLLLALAVLAQVSDGPFVIVNTATGLVFEDHRNFALEVGNPIVGASYDASRVVLQSWSLQLAPGFAFAFRNDRLVGRQTVYARINGSQEEGANLVTTQDFGSPFFWQQAFPAPGIAAFIHGLLEPFAITAPKVANGTLTLEPYEATNSYQHWVLVPVPTPGPAAGNTDSLPATALPVATPLLGKDKGSTKD